MFMKILDESEIKKFGELTGIDAKKIFISKNNRYYYVNIVDYDLKLRISKELASKFV